MTGWAAYVVCYERNPVQSVYKSRNVLPAQKEVMEVQEKAKMIAEVLKVLANENRLIIFCALMERPMTVGEVAKYVPKITFPALSQHLALLKAHGILDSNKSGLNVTYSVADYRVKEIIDLLKKCYCE
jgi:DNA-binding transcriptional ArsR family regulator